MRPISSRDWPGRQPQSGRVVEAFEDLWRSGEPSLDRYWAGLGPTRSLADLSALVKVDLQYRFDRGERPTAADYLERFPELAASDDRVVSVIYEEFCLLQEAGEDPDSAQFCERYGPWRDSLQSQLVYHRELSRVAGEESAPTKYPRPGERFATYQLRSILGIGGAARVYLATDDDLGGRKVALKVSASVGREPSILANLDHRNIVPILSVVESESGLRGFCMPYRPGATLEELSRRLGRDSIPRGARAVWEAMKPSIDADNDGLEEDRPGWSDFPVRGTYPEAIAWVGLALANALTYLHGRGVLHRDIKPANVLLAYREGPQLLDFNLAHAPHAAEHAQAALKGGTLPYMAPEQLRAFLDPAGWEHVGSPADLYALGLVLRGLLTGQSPEVPNPNLPLPRAIRALHDRRSEAAEPVRQFNPGVPPALESIIAGCLEFEPSARYAGASDLAEDLRRFLARRPLKFADNPSLIERGVNFLYRNRMIAAGIVCLVVSFAIAGTFSRKALNQAIPAAMARPPTAIRDLPEFRRAVLDLDSKVPENWARARNAFDVLRKAHPESAWPWLYQGLTLEKIADHQPKAERNRSAGNEMFQVATQCHDFLRALQGRLTEEPASPTLNTMHARSILDDRHDAGRFDRALPILLSVLATDPERLSALVMIADLERHRGFPEEAIRRYRRAIELGEANSGHSAQDVNRCRWSLLPLLMRQADGQIEGARTAGDRRISAGTLDRLGATLEALDRGWDAAPPPNGTPDERVFLRAFYGGVVASGRLVIAKADGNPVQAARDFAEARKQFEAALRVGQNSGGIGARNRLQIESKLKELERRAAPSTSSSTPARPE